MFPRGYILTAGGVGALDKQAVRDAMSLAGSNGTPPIDNLANVIGIGTVAASPVPTVNAFAVTGVTPVRAGAIVLDDGTECLVTSVSGTTATVTRADGTPLSSPPTVLQGATVYNYAGARALGFDLSLLASALAGDLITPTATATAAAVLAAINNQGTGDTSVTSVNTNSDAIAGFPLGVPLQATDPNNGALSGVTVRAYLWTNYQARNYIPIAQVYTGDDGQWLLPMLLTHGVKYAIEYSKVGIQTNAVPYTVPG